MNPETPHLLRYGIAVALLAMAGLLMSGVSHAAGTAFWSYPAIAGYGRIHVWPQSTLKPEADEHYKAVFNVTHAAAMPGKIAIAYEHVARAVNVFAAAGVPVKNLKYVVIVHGKATPTVLSDKAYRARFHTANPNLAVIAALEKAGVKVLVCGNALGEMHLTPAQVAPGVGIALSALSTLVMLEDEGYALVPM